MQVRFPYRVRMRRELCHQPRITSDETMDDDTLEFLRGQLTGGIGDLATAIEAAVEEYSLEFDKWLEQDGTFTPSMGEMGGIPALAQASRSLAHSDDSKRALQAVRRLEEANAELWNHLENIDRLLDDAVSRGLIYGSPELWEQFHEIKGNIARIWVTKERALQVCAWRIYGVSPTEMARRMRDIFEALRENPGKFPDFYLRRVADCYVKGLIAEFAVMARAALESALKQVITDEVVRSSVGAGPRVTLERRCEAALALGHLSEDGFRAAQEIRKAGNDAVHFRPALAKNPRLLLMALSRALAELDKTHHEGPSSQVK